MTPEDFTHVWEKRVAQDAARDPIYAAQLYEILDRLNDPTAPRSPLDELITHPSESGAYDLKDAAALYEVALNLNLGWAVIAQIPSVADSTSPAASAHDASNPPLPFRAIRTRSGELRLTWDDSITLTHAALANRPIIVTYTPGQVPLALGAIAPGHAIWHLRYSGGLTRLPAGHRDIILILSTHPQPGLLVPSPTFVGGAPSGVGLYL
jgi:hypothetical protein